MAENNESVESIRSFVLEAEPVCEAKEEPSCVAKEPRRVEITVEPEEKLTFSETIPDKCSDPESEISYITPAIHEALNLDLTNASDEETLANNVQLRFFLCRTTELLKEKTGLCRNLEKQIKALELQTNSLKDLVSVTKNMLSVKNLEVLSLHDDIRKMEESIAREKEKHRLILSNMNETVKVVTKMKGEHKLQMDMLAELQDEYKKKIEFLEKENKLLHSQMCEEPRSCKLTTEKVGEGDTMVPEELSSLPQ